MCHVQHRTDLNDTVTGGATHSANADNYNVLQHLYTVLRCGLACSVV
jgi:hypothetical protein